MFFAMYFNVCLCVLKTVIMILMIFWKHFSHIDTWHDADLKIDKILVKLLNCTIKFLHFAYINGHKLLVYEL